MRAKVRKALVGVKVSMAWAGRHVSDAAILCQVFRLVPTQFSLRTNTFHSV